MEEREYLLKEDRLYSNFLIEEDLSEVDPDTDLIIRFEEDRQAKKVILRPSGCTR